ncbi:hypothetical protein CBR_g27935 [Chara braunii]|uniref:Integrase catalytic domain-containing protein n=1 Tax=Chara braunii TaxID=69332 RepID=A0A388L8R6_CHABU|nr:hypothetical protein CBR_g27935 [Chara braunii]|eukprot:GBG78710.1 hypothetical protein CBR_g27935 [Chara braunii]
MALKRWWHFLLGRRRFTWVTDNNPLTYYKTQDTVSSTIGRWMYFIDQFAFTPKHLAGLSNRAADALSRRPDLCAMTHHAFAFDEELQRHFIRGYECDPDFATLYAQLSSDHPPASHYRIIDGYLLLHSRGTDLLCVPQDRRRRTRLLVCRRSKPRNRNPYGELRSMPIPREPDVSIAMDVTGPFPRDRLGHDGILTVVDRLSKYARFLPCKYYATTPELARVLHTGWICSHGVPEDIVSNRDTRFMSAFWTSLMQESDTKMKPSSARHPQTDRQTERAHQTAQMMLRTLIRPDQKDWVDLLPDIEFAYNTSLHLAIGVIPFELHHGGRKGLIFADLLLPRTTDIDATCSPASVRKYRKLLAQARANMQKAQTECSSKPTGVACHVPSAEPLLDYAEKVLARCEGDAALSGASSQCTGVLPASSGSSGGDSLLTTSERIGVVTPLSSTGPNASFPTDCELGVKGGGAMYDVGIEEDAVTSLDLHGGGGLGSQPGSVGSASCGPTALPSSGVSSGIRGTSSERDHKESVPSGIHELNLHMYRARLLMLVRNLKATKREVKLALNLIRDHMPALVLKAQLEYCRGNFRKAIKLLTTCFCGGGSPGDAASVLAGVAGAHLDKGSTAMLLSNLGCIHFRLGKHNIAAAYFVKALENYMAVGADRPLCVRSFAKDKTLHVLCNMGIQQLYLGNPLVGFRCFQESVRMFYNRPLLWLRLAECCISSHAKGLLEDRKREQGRARGREEVILRIVGEERWRQVLLPTGGLGSGGGAKAGNPDFHVAETAGEGGLPEGVGSAQGEGGRPGTGGGGVKATAAGVFPPKWSKAPPQQGQGPEEGASGPVGPGRNSCLWDVRQEPSLEYASHCLRNALTLLDQLDSTANAAAAAVALPDADSGSVGQNASACIHGGQQHQLQGMQHQQSGGSRKSTSGTVDRRAGSVAPSAESKDGEGGAVAPSVPSAVTVIASAVAVHEDERRMECSTVQQCILANLAYVELVLENPVASLAAAERLLRIQGCCPQYSFLGHMYAAEALCMLDRPTVAAEHLTTCMLEHTNSMDTTQGSNCGNVETEEENGQKWRTVEYGEASTDGSDITTGTGRRSSASSAAGGGIASSGTANAGDIPGALSGTTSHASLYVNLAAVYAMQGELLQAQQCALQALKVSPTNPLAILAVVYVELSRGRKQDALDMLKHCRNIKCLWGGVASDATSNAAGTMGLRPAAVQALS